MREALMVALGGALGAMSRYGLTTAVGRIMGTAFPYGTLVVNCTGSFIIGFVMQVCLNTTHISPTFQTALTIGFLGAFTTFSTFSYETVVLFKDGNWSHGVMNVVIHIAVSIGMVILGMLAARLVIARA